MCPLSLQTGCDHIDAQSYIKIHACLIQRIMRSLFMPHLIFRITINLEQSTTRHLLHLETPFLNKLNLMSRLIFSVYRFRNENKVHFKQAPNASISTSGVTPRTRSLAKIEIIKWNEGNNFELMDLCPKTKTGFKLVSEIVSLNTLIQFNSPIHVQQVAN